MRNAEKKVKEFIRQRKLFPKQEKILLAVSGGADSAALVCILNKIISNKLFIAHVNHQLRGKDSLDDEEYVRSLAEKYKLPIMIERVDVNSYARQKKLSIETAARELRRDALLKMAEKTGCTLIATAHQANDNAETIIHRILRGTSYKGLAGIRPKTDIDGRIFVRPMLCLRRNEIEQYLKAQNISWQKDYTNDDCRFTRNRIRHKLLPYLMKENTRLIELLNELSQKCENFALNIEKHAEIAAKDCIASQKNNTPEIKLSDFLKLPAAIQVELIQRILTQLGCGLQKYTSQHYLKIIKFVRTANAGKILTIPSKAKITKGYAHFFISMSKEEKEESHAVILNVPGKTVFKNHIIETKIINAAEIKNIKDKSKSVEWFDCEQIKMPLTIRQRQKGDKFKPFKESKFKKVGKFLTSQKIDSQQRQEVFIICDKEKILWVAPIRRSNEAILTSTSHNILQINML